MSGDVHVRCCKGVGGRFPRATHLIITGVSKETLENEGKPLGMDFLHERGLELSEEKTRRTHREDGCDFLGQNARKDNGKFLMVPSKKNVQAFLADIRKVIKDNTQAPAYWLMATRNTTRRGWANWHRHAVAKSPCVHVDTALFKPLWRWGRRRHPKKGKRWVAERSCGRSGNSNWHCCGTAQDHEGKTIQNWPAWPPQRPSTKSTPRYQGTVTPTTLPGKSPVKTVVAYRWKRPCKENVD